MDYHPLFTLRIHPESCAHRTPMVNQSGFVWVVFINAPCPLEAGAFSVQRALCTGPTTGPRQMDLMCVLLFRASHWITYFYKESTVIGLKLNFEIHCKGFIIYVFYISQNIVFVFNFSVYFLQSILEDELAEAITFVALSWLCNLYHNVWCSYH